MARLRNRIVKADMWTDAELLRWHRDKRRTYQGLWALAEDSGCLEDDPWGWKLLLWPSPLDADITVDLIQQWRDELIEADKLVPYEADGKRYLWIRTFHEHEQPRNPQAPNLPLPLWVRWVSQEVPRKDGGRGGSYTRNVYVVDSRRVPERTSDESRMDTGETKRAYSSLIASYKQPYSSLEGSYKDACPGDDDSTEGTTDEPSDESRMDKGETKHAISNLLAAPTPVQSSPVQSSPEIYPSGAAEPARPSRCGRTGKAPPENGGTLVAYYLDRSRERGRVVTSSDKGQVARYIGEVLKQGATHATVKAALDRMIERELRPGLLGQLVNEAKAQAPPDPEAHAERIRALRGGAGS